MLREYSFLIKAKILFDLLLVCFVILGAEQVNVHGGSIPDLTPHFLVLFINLLTWLSCARGFGLYDDLRLKPFSVEWVMFLKAFGLYALVTSFMAFQVFHQYPYEKGQFLLQCALLFFLFPAQKLFLRIVFKRLRNSRSLRRKVLIVGAGNTGLRFYEAYVKSHHYGYELTGFLDDAINPGINGRYLGKTSDIENVMTKHELDEVVVALPVSNESDIKNVVIAAEKQGKRVRIIPNYDSYSEGLQVDERCSNPVITPQFLPLDFVDNKVFKRIFDIFFSLFVIVFFLSWLFPIIAVLIKLLAKGPVFFKQERWGLNNKTIICWKFRTMDIKASDVDENGRYRQASVNDSRITSIGRFLRRTNLDELPQFFNTLLGSMSVVGPRPHPVQLNEISKGFIQGYEKRHWVKPGITGWAQVHGYRGETSKPYLMQKRVEYDVWYMENWSLWLDFQIIFQTVTNMIKGDKNAY